MTGPSGDAGAAAIPPSVEARRSETDTCGGRGGPAQTAVRVLSEAPAKGHFGAAQSGKNGSGPSPRADAPIYAALDLGTNNCRLLVARPSRRGFLVIDAFSRIIRLGEGVHRTGQLSEAAMARTIDALRICSEKMRRRGVARSRLIATEACRAAANSGEFIDRVRRETGLALEIVTRETEARLAVSGCASLIDRSCNWALVFDIGGGSSELIWLNLNGLEGPLRRSIYDRLEVQNCIAGWTSLPIGVVNLAERHGGKDVSPDAYEDMVADVSEALEKFEAKHDFRNRIDGAGSHFLGTSGTVTTIAGIHLRLPAYDRSKVDGCWIGSDEVRVVSDRLLRMSYADRVSQPCIGQERADLVLAGCAILEALLRAWPCQRLRVADRGLREGILATLMAEDGHGRRPPRHRSGGWR